MEEKHVGLVLRSIDYKDRQKIITVFTSTKGMLSLIIKGINRKKTHLLTLASPFTEAEYHISVRRSDLYTFIDGTPLNTNNALRTSLAHIEAATTMAHALLRTQMPGKASPDLYKLTIAYLKRLPDFKDPTTLTASFLLKLLKHEGQLHLSMQCTHCENEPTHLFKGENYCQTHRPSYATPYSAEEWPILNTLAASRSIDELKQTQVTPELKEKIQAYFKEEI